MEGILDHATKKLFFKKNLQIFSVDTDKKHSNLGNIYLDKSVFPIFGGSTLNVSPNEFLKLNNKHTINSEDCEVFQQGTAGDGLKIKNPILTKTIIGTYGAIVKIGNPTITEEESGKLNCLVKLKEGKIYISTIQPTFIGKEKEVFWGCIKKDIIEEGFLYPHNGLFGFHEGGGFISS